MRSLHRTLAAGLAALMLLNLATPVNACGPVYTMPIFVFETSPDLPFAEFTKGKIGIVRPTFGRKTLVIAYRFLNGGSFTDQEQNDLLAALKGTAPEDDGETAVKAWIDARKEFVKAEESLPPIYTERRGGGYDFFPNCTKNAFEVAIETLKNRASAYGTDDKNVSTWLAAQDTVFQNCSSGNQIPAELGAESPTWLRKDRDYQIAAAYFYSLNFEEARARFERIAIDYESPWQSIAPYLVARTFVRQASLAEAGPKKRELYEQAEIRLQSVSATGGKFGAAANKLLSLVRYHLRPEERVVELGGALTRGADENLRQDLIDYVWLLDKFESQILKAEEERKKKLNPSAGNEQARDFVEFAIDNARSKLLQEGVLINVYFYPRKADGTQNFTNSVNLDFKHDMPEAEILRAFEDQIGRPLTTEEIKSIKLSRAGALEARAYGLSPNRRWGRDGMTEYEGDYSPPDHPTLDLIPEFLRADDLSDWILTLQTNDPRAYAHALAKWRLSDSPAWMLVALSKAQKSSPQLRELMGACEKLTHADAGYATAAYHLVRLKVEMGQLDEARKLLDEVIEWQSVLPVSAQNQFLQQRTKLAAGLNDFLKSAQRRPVAFFRYGVSAKISDILAREKEFWNPEYHLQTKEEYQHEVEEEYKELLPWDDRVAFDAETVEILNWHFSLQLLLEAARNRNVPEYLKRNLVLAVWTRAILLKNDRLALDIAPQVLQLAPEMSSVFEPYMKARTVRKRHRAALYVLLKFPSLSPFLIETIPSFPTSEKLDYYFGEAWWCPLPETDYTNDGKEFPKVVPKPSFLTAAQLETARRERLALTEVGDGKSYLGQQVVDWAKSSPADPRLPEALFIATKANETYKYGCDGWDHDEETRTTAEKLLRERYPRSPWTSKLTEDLEK